jgi:hypothetical protein
MIDKTFPTELMLTTKTCHLITSCLLFNVPSTLRTPSSIKFKPCMTAIIRSLAFEKIIFGTCQTSMPESAMCEACAIFAFDTCNFRTRKTFEIMQLSGATFMCTPNKFGHLFEASVDQMLIILFEYDMIFARRKKNISDYIKSKSSIAVLFRTCHLFIIDTRTFDKILYIFVYTRITHGSFNMSACVTIIALEFMLWFIHCTYSTLAGFMYIFVETNITDGLFFSE